MIGPGIDQVCSFPNPGRTKEAYMKCWRVKMMIIKNLLEKYAEVVNAFLGRNFNVSDSIFGLENVEWHSLASYMSCIN